MLGLTCSRRWISIATIALSTTSIGACKEDPAPVVESEESTGEPPPPIDFQPSNIELEPMYEVGDVTLDLDCTIGDGGRGTLCKADPSSYVFFDHTQSDGSVVGVYVMENLVITENTLVDIEEDTAIVLVAQSTIVNEGRLYMRPGENGGFAGSSGDIVGLGPGAATGIDGPVTGGGGGGYCGRGGSHGDGEGAGPSYGDASIVPLVGGSSGGERNSGGGGGALQLVAGVSITIGKTITLPGAGGEDGGGGSGGALLLEAPIVNISGRVSTNGGGGASGDKSDGVEGRDRADAAAGGQGNGNTPGGEGSAGSLVTGADGTATVMTAQEFGSGGGGAGWIRINTESGVAEITGSVSPGLDTDCATQGVLG
ncbi:MAG: hypothetical protein JKY37_16785 [Nannocystaceae bacterium]|nr:hypothetical protein [Nannocystaceae bacterium]